MRKGRRRAVGALLALSLLGCSQQGHTSPDTEPTLSAAVQPESGSAGVLAIPAHLPGPKGTHPAKRRLLFTVTGLARVPGNLPERQGRLVGLEAGLVDALYRIVCATPGDFEFLKGEPGGTDFVAVLGDDLTLRHHRPFGAPPELELVLDDRGRTIRLHVVDGRLTHDPYDSSAVSKVLERSGGAIKLLYARWSDQPGRYCVQLGYYELATSGRAERPHRLADAPPSVAVPCEPAQ